MVIVLLLSVQLVRVHEVHLEILQAEGLILLARLQRYVVEISHVGKGPQKLGGAQGALLEEELADGAARENEARRAEAVGEPLADLAVDNTSDDGLALGEVNHN